MIYAGFPIKNPPFFHDELTPFWLNPDVGSEAPWPHPGGVQCLSCRQETDENTSTYYKANGIMIHKCYISIIYYENI